MGTIFEADAKRDIFRVEKPVCEEWLFEVDAPGGILTWGYGGHAGVGAKVMVCANCISKPVVL